MVTQRTKKKKTARELSLELADVVGNIKLEQLAYNTTMDSVITEVLSNKTHAEIGQLILEDVMKQVFSGDITIAEASDWYENKWLVRSNSVGSPDEIAIKLGLPDISSVIRDTFAEGVAEVVECVSVVYEANRKYMENTAKLQNKKVQ